MKWILVIMMIATTVNAEDAFLCIGEKSTGFKTTTGEYSDFTTHKYILKYREQKKTELTGDSELDGLQKRLDALEPPGWIVIDHEDNYEPFLKCQVFKGSPKRKRHFKCGDFVFSETTMRFQAYYFGDWMHNLAKNDVAVEIGKCSKI